MTPSIRSGTILNLDSSTPFHQQWLDVWCNRSDCQGQPHRTSATTASGPGSSLTSYTQHAGDQPLHNSSMSNSCEYSLPSRDLPCRSTLVFGFLAFPLPNTSSMSLHQRPSAAVTVDGGSRPRVSQSVSESPSTIKVLAVSSKWCLRSVWPCRDSPLHRQLQRTVGSFETFFLSQPRHTSSEGLSLDQQYYRNTSLITRRSCVPTKPRS